MIFSVVIGLVIGLGIGGAVSHHYYNRAIEVNSRWENAQVQLEELTEKESMVVALYFIKETENESYLVPELRKIPYSRNFTRTAVQELIAGPKTQDLQGVFSGRTKVLELEIKEDLAVIDLSKEATKLSRGAWGESLTVSALVNTLTKFAEINQVKILIEGKEVETLSGHVDLTLPLRRNEQVVRLTEKN